MAKVIYEKRDQIAYITLNRPEVHNAIDTQTDELLFEAWTDFRDDPDVRIAILTGAGDKTYVELPGATHYLAGRRREAMAIVVDWLRSRVP